MLIHKNLRRLSAVSAVTTALCSFGTLATAAGISWADWGLGREVASGKMVKWTVNKAVSYTHLTLPTTPYV